MSFYTRNAFEPSGIYRDLKVPQFFNEYYKHVNKYFSCFLFMDTLVLHN